MPPDIANNDLAAQVPASQSRVPPVTPHHRRGRSGQAWTISGFGTMVSMSSGSRHVIVRAWPPAKANRSRPTACL